MAYTTIKKSTDYFNTKLHTGDGGGSGSSTGIGFQPDMVWSKSRTEALNHTMFDSVRGAGSNKELTPNGAGTEGGANSAGFGYISAFNSDGYSWTAGSTNTENFNKSSQNYANWCWKANGAGSANTDGSISSTVSANTTSGFSIVTYTGGGGNATVGHGLGVAPGMMIIKNRSASQSWVVYHQSIGNTKNLYLNNTDATNTTSGWFNNTSPTSTVFTIGNDGAVSGNGNNLVAYCFAEKQGFSKFGSYTGNGSTDGTFVYTGFKPAWVMIKANLAGEEWGIWDSTRNTFNIMSQRLQANSSAAENTFNGLDFTSNGFKLRSANSAVNRSGDTLIYMAFAEQPLVGDNPATAR